MTTKITSGSLLDGEAWHLALRGPKNMEGEELKIVSATDNGIVTITMARLTADYSRRMLVCCVVEADQCHHRLGS